MYCGIDVGFPVTPGDQPAVCGVAPLPSAGGAGIGDEDAGRADVAGLLFLDEDGAAGLPFLEDDGAEPVFFFVGVVKGESDARPLPLLLPLPGGGGGEEPPAVDMLKLHGQQELEVGREGWFGRSGSLPDGY
jgi:hypothetical protein